MGGIFQGRTVDKCDAREHARNFFQHKRCLQHRILRCVRKHHGVFILACMLQKFQHGGVVHSKAGFIIGKQQPAQPQVLEDAVYLRYGGLAMAWVHHPQPANKSIGVLLKGIGNIIVLFFAAVNSFAGRVYGNGRDNCIFNAVAVHALQSHLRGIPPVKVFPNMDMHIYFFAHTVTSPPQTLFQNSCRKSFLFLLGKGLPALPAIYPCRKIHASMGCLTQT